MFCVRQIGEPGGEAEGMGTPKSAGAGGAARLLPGTLSWPRAENGPQSQQQHATGCRWQQRDL